MNDVRRIFTSELLDLRPGGVTVERPDPLQPYDPTGRLGSVVTVAGLGRYVLVRQLSGQQWLADRLADPG